MHRWLGICLGMKFLVLILSCFLFASSTFEREPARLFDMPCCKDVIVGSLYGLWRGFYQGLKLSIVSTYIPRKNDLKCKNLQRFHSGNLLCLRNSMFLWVTACFWAFFIIEALHSLASLLSHLPNRPPPWRPSCIECQSGAVSLFHHDLGGFLYLHFFWQVFKLAYISSNPLYF